MTDLPTRLNALRPTIEALMRTAGTPGLSLSVVHQGKEILLSSTRISGYREKAPNDSGNNSTYVFVDGSRHFGLQWALSLKGREPNGTLRSTMALPGLDLPYEIVLVIC